MRIYTRTGDDGTTVLGSGRRVSKDALRIEAYGTVDELNSVVGTALAESPVPATAESLTRVQGELFDLGAALAVPAPERGDRPLPRIREGQIEALEQECDALDADLPELRSFILPGGTRAAALLHLARTVCRRAERRLVALARQEDVDAGAIRYLNRLSDLLFLMARGENRADGRGDVRWRGAGDE